MTAHSDQSASGEQLTIYTVDAPVRPQPTAAQARVLAVLERHERMTAGEIRDELGARSRASITTALRNLKAAGWVRETDPGGADWYRERNYQHADWPDFR